MTGKVTIRTMRPGELDWVNQKYDEVDFVHSAPGTARIAVAEVDGVRAGIGRLIMIDETTCELSGIYVFQGFRGLGLAKRISKYLIDLAEPDLRVFCLPFTRLEGLYRQVGFKTVEPPPDLPAALCDKLEWTNKRYADGVSLMQYCVDN